MFCQECGGENKDEAKFCSGCGRSLHASQELGSHPNISQQESVAPRLWNPSAIANWSILFTPILGAYLNRLNWQALGEDRRAKVSLAWLILSVFVMVLSFVISPALLFWLLILWYFFHARSQIRYIKNLFGAEYPRRSWGGPLVVSLSGFAAIVLVSVSAFYVDRTSSMKNWDCAELADTIKGNKLQMQNVFGGTFSIITLSNLAEIERTEEQLVCSGTARLSDGRTVRLRLKGEIDESDVILSAEELLW